VQSEQGINSGEQGMNFPESAENREIPRVSKIGGIRR
jgi:hypothetical protein